METHGKKSTTMKRTLKSFALAAVAALSAVACTKTDIEEAVAAPGEALVTTLYAAAPGGSTTKVEFTESGEDKISLSWEESDVITIYDTDDEKVCDLTCVDATTGRFEATGVAITDGATYIAKYGSDENLATQNGDDINNLDAACYLKTEFTYYNSGTSITFEHQMAIMTFKFISENRPAQLVFENGEEVYTVTYSEIEADAVTDIYTSHIMINPCEEVERTLTFSLYDSEGTAYDIRTVDTDKAYVAGKRYTASVSNLENSVWSGTGTSDDPYIIENAAQLRALSTSVSSGSYYSGVYFEMTSNIDLNDEAFTPIGNSYSNSFQGTFNGGGYEVSGLYVTVSQYAGLFGSVNGATIKNLGVSSGSVTGTSYVGGIAGYLRESSTIINCYNKATVTKVASDDMMDMEMESSTGGIVGFSYKGTIINCYNVGDVTANSSMEVYAGGIVGMSWSATITACYNVGAISATASYYSYSGGIAGMSDGTVSGCYWDSDLSGTSYGIGAWEGSNSGASPKSSDEMKSDEILIKLNNSAYTYNKENSEATQACKWVSGGNYPELDLDSSPSYTTIVIFSNGSGTETDPYKISSADELRTLSDVVNEDSMTFSGEYFLMTNNIDLGGEDNKFTPIGNTSDDCFQGTFDGGGFEISGLYIEESSSTGIGFFRYINNATIKNLGINGSVTAYGHTGGLAGFAYNSTIINCYNKASIAGVGTGYDTGGFVGQIVSSTVINCYNAGSVKGAQSVGGFVGCSNNSTVTNCYNAGSVEGTSNIGGFVGYSYSSATPNMTYCYYDSTVFSGSAFGYSTGGTISDTVGDYSTDEMKAASFVTLLNNNAYTYNTANSSSIQACAWEATSSTPTLDFDSLPTEPMYGSWADYAATSFADGVEYSSDITSYTIETAAQAAYLTSLVNSGTTMSGVTFTLSGNISLGAHEWVPIGNSSYSFKGTFDGGGYEVSGLYVTDSQYAGLFGYINEATIKNLGVSSGSVTGTSYAGGIVGYVGPNSTIVNCYNKANITSNSYSAGGIAGCTYYNISITNCYNMGAIETLGSSYDSWDAVGAGGIVGYTMESITVTSCYNVGAISGSYSGGIVGSYRMESPTASYCYWNSDLSGVSYGIGGRYGSNNGASPKSIDEMQADDFATLLNNGAYTYNEANSTATQACAWKATSGGYPTIDFSNQDPSYTLIKLYSGGYGTEAEPYQIATADDIRSFATNVDCGDNYSGSYFELTSNIDLGGESNEFTPIGSSWSSSFKGTFDGGGYEVSGLYINQESSYYQGLFGITCYATIKNLGVSGSVSGYASVGGVIGYAENTIVENCYNTASITGSSEYVGGIIGKNVVSTVINCYNTGAIEGTRCVGGIAGDANASNGTCAMINCYNTAKITATTENVGGIVGTSVWGVSMINCYNSGLVEGPSNAGGVMGFNDSSGVITNCYYNSEVYSGNAVGTDGNSSTTTVTKMSTDEMQAASFVVTLNNNAVTYNDAAGSSATQACAWEAVSEGYPTLDFDGDPSDATVSNNITFEDSTFESALVSSFDTDGDGGISYDEASAVTAISLYSAGISSLAGIEYFTNLKSLICWDNNLSQLDVSKNTELTALRCWNNDLSKLDVSNNTQLQELMCFGNNFTELDVSKNTELTTLECGSNNLTKLDVSKNTELTNLECYANSLTELDVSKNTELTYLNCTSNSLTELDLSYNTNLQDLNCSNNLLTTLDVSNCPSLWEMHYLMDDSGFEFIYNCIMQMEQITLYISFEQYINGLSGDNFENYPDVTVTVKDDEFN